MDIGSYLLGVATVVVVEFAALFVAVWRAYEYKHKNNKRDD